jgi:thiosulfate dehydrogenase
MTASNGARLWLCARCYHQTLPVQFGRVARIKRMNNHTLSFQGTFGIILWSLSSGVLSAANPSTARVSISDAPNVITRPTIEELKARRFLDDYESNVVFGYNIVMKTERYARRYTGNRLRCTSCHLKGGTQPDGFPLNVAGIYPKWRSKNSVRNGIGLRIRECFLYSLNGVMPPEEAPEVVAVAAYIHYLSEGEVVGRAPANWGVPTLPDTFTDPNPARGSIVYKKNCSVCHGVNGEGNDLIPPLWGADSYSAGAGLNKIEKAAGFIWANMPLGQERSLSHQEAKDVAAFLHLQVRPFDPREGRLKKFAEKIYHWLTRFYDGEEESWARDP